MSSNETKTTTLWGKWIEIENRLMERRISELSKLLNEDNEQTKMDFDNTEDVKHIPSDIFLAIDMDAYARLILMCIQQNPNEQLLIQSEDTYKGLAMFCACSVSTVKRRIQTLIDAGYLLEDKTDNGMYFYTYISQS